MAVYQKCNWESIPCVTKGAAEVLGTLHGQEKPFHSAELKEVAENGSAPKKPLGESQQIIAPVSNPPAARLASPPTSTTLLPIHSPPAWSRGCPPS